MEHTGLRAVARQVKRLVGQSSQDTALKNGKREPRVSVAQVLRIQMDARGAWRYDERRPAFPLY